MSSLVISASAWSRFASEHSWPSGSVLHPALAAVGFVALSALYTLSPSKLPFSDWFKTLRDKEGNRIPDGPTGLPVLGCYTSLTRFPELTCHKWYQRYGPLYSFWIGNQLFVVVSDPGIAKDLFVTNGAIFSSRKDMFIKCQTIFVGRGITATGYNERWRKHRRIAASWLNPRSVASYVEMLDYEAVFLLRGLYTQGKAGAEGVEPEHYSKLYSLNCMLTVVFGIRAETIDEPLVARALYLSREFMNCTSPVSNLVDFITPLQWFPSVMATRGKKLHDDLVETYGSMIDDVQRRMQAKEDVPESLVKRMLTIREQEGLDRLDMIMLASAFLIAGVETTASITQWFCGAIPSHPDLQRKAHEELDAVVGRDRLPTADDEMKLPYCRALIKEVERVFNPFPLITPHYSSEDFSYRGMFIPKDTMVICNAYSMHVNPDRYSDPHSFNPDRYLGDNTSSIESANLSNPYDRDGWMFGVGRRICPGMLVAQREVWQMVSRLLWAFEFSDIPGESLNLDGYDGLNSRSPTSFRVRMTPRHENVGKVIGL